MQQNQGSQTPVEEKKMTEGASCRTGSCGGAGMCPGIALFLSAAVGLGVAGYFALPALAWITGVPLFLLLVTGYWQRIFVR